MKIATLLSSLVLASSCAHSRPSTEPQPRTTQWVVIDAGSSGTRARVFEAIEGQPESLHHLGTACENDSPLARDITGVLASYACARPDILDPANTPVLVYATGGMRTLAEQQPEQAEQRHVDVVEALHEQGVVEVESRTITGSDEGLYEWIGINHQEHRLDRDDRDREQPTVTILEFGGASVQVAFALPPDQPVPESLAADEVRTIELGGVEHRVFTRSYLHCGMNEAREAMAGPGCFPSDCATQPTCTASLPASLTGQPTAGELAACDLDLTRSLTSDSACMALRSPPPPLPNRPIRLVSVLAFVFAGLDAVDEQAPDHHVDLARARTAAERICAGTAAELEQRANIPEKVRGNLCFSATHALRVLDAWGVTAGDPRPGIGALDHSWTWGVVRERMDH